MMGLVLPGLVGVEAAAAAPVTLTYTDVGHTQSFTVPPGVSTLAITLTGGGGGDGWGSGAGSGGAGRYVTGDLAVGAGDVVTIEVAGGGANASSPSSSCYLGGDSSSGGKGGASYDIGSTPAYGGPGANADYCVAGGGGGGGGATIVLLTPSGSSSASLVAVAGGGGGGGGGGGCCSYDGGNGGSGGAGSGSNGSGYGAGSGGGGGASGSVSGGQPSNPPGGSSAGGAGGGGGGYAYGGAAGNSGGGGAGGGGGGGSGDYFVGPLTNATDSTASGGAGAEGVVTITYNAVAATSTTVTTSTNPSVFGQAATFTATVSAASGTPTGTVTFYDGTTPLGTGALSAWGQATFVTSGLSVGTHAITASYGGDANFAPSTSSPALVQAVDQAATSTTVTTSTNPSVFGQAVTFTATVSPTAPGAGIPTGTVTFYDGATPLGTGALSAWGQATFATSGLSVGTHAITASYGGDANFAPSTSSPAFVQAVDQAATTITVTTSANPSVYGQAVTFTATVSPAAPGAGTPTGTVTFYHGTTLIGVGDPSTCCSVQWGAGGMVYQATVTVSSLSVSTHAITAVYGGDNNFASSTSSPPLTQPVNRAATTTTVKSSANPSVYGQPVGFTATVAASAPGAGTPTGTITFYKGSKVLGTRSLSVVGGRDQAVFSTHGLSLGTDPITAVYGGDSSFASSTSSPALEQVVSKAATTTMVTSSTNPSGYGQPVTFTATVSPTAPGAGVPTGTVTFSKGTTILGTGNLSVVRGRPQATLTVSTLSVGTHAITAVYGGDRQFTKSTVGPPLDQVVYPAATTATVSLLS